MISAAPERASATASRSCSAGSGTGLPMIVSNAILLRIIFSSGVSALAKPEGGRPEFWPVTVAEWGVIIFLLLWVLLVSYYRMRHRPAA